MKHHIVAICILMACACITALVADKPLYKQLPDEPYSEYQNRVLAFHRYVIDLLESDPFVVEPFSKIFFPTDLDDPDARMRITMTLSRIGERTSFEDERLIALAPLFVRMICKNYRGGLDPLYLLYNSGKHGIPFLKQLVECPNISNIRKQRIRDRIDEIEYNAFGIGGMTFP